MWVLARALLGMFGLFSRLQITETPASSKAIEKAERVEGPLAPAVAGRCWFLLLSPEVAGRR